MTVALPTLNQRLAAVVAGYRYVESGQERLWLLPDGTSTAHCPNFEAGERWEDLEQGLRRAGALAAVQDRLGRALGGVASTAHRRDALLIILDMLSVDSRVARAEGAALSALGLELDRAASAPDRRALLGTLRRVRTRLSLTQQLVFFDRPTYCRDDAGEFWVACQTYAPRSDLASLLDILAAHGLDGRVLEVPPFAPTARLLLIRAVCVPTPQA